MQWKVVELPVDVELTHRDSLSCSNVRCPGAPECGIEVQLVQAIHLWEVRHRESTSSGERPSFGTRSIAFRDAHRITVHLGFDITITLIFGLARRVDVHHEPPDAAVVRELDLRMSLAHARESVDFIADELVASASHTFHRHCVASKQCDKPVAFRRLIALASGEEQKCNDDPFHWKSFHVRAAVAVRKYVAAHHAHDCVLSAPTTAFPFDYKSISFKGVEREKDPDSGPAPHHHRGLNQAERGGFLAGCVGHAFRHGTAQPREP